MVAEVAWKLKTENGKQKTENGIIVGPVCVGINSAIARQPSRAERSEAAKRLFIAGLGEASHERKSQPEHRWSLACYVYRTREIRHTQHETRPDARDRPPTGRTFSFSRINLRKSRCNVRSQLIINVKFNQNSF